MMRVRSNWPVSCALIRKYVDNSIGHRTPGGTYANEPSLNTALFKPAKKLSLKGTTVPRYFRTRSGCSRTASENEQKLIPSSASRSLNVVATESLSRTASTATPAWRSCSTSGIPGFGDYARSSGTTSLRLWSGYLGLWWGELLLSG